MNKNTPRTQIHFNINGMIGRMLTSNLFPTLKGKLLYCNGGKCYFEIVSNPNFTRYNGCDGKIEYLPQDLVMCVKFDED